MSYLSANILHVDKSGLVVINKPYGLPLRPSPGSPFCLEGCLNDLAQIIEVKSLKVLKSASRLIA
jgi:hypothetical protein